MKTYERIQQDLLQNKYTWLVTGAAGFIGSNLCEALLKLNQKVVGIDNLSTGNRDNLEQIIGNLNSNQAENFKFIEGDIRSYNDCKSVMENIDFVLHHAAIVSVPRSIEQPELTHAVNVEGFLNVLNCARHAGVKRFIYASSSAVYGNVKKFPITEKALCSQLSPYAVSKFVNESYALTYSHCYQLETVGLRYFNVYGPRQDPNSPYAGVIPKWITAFLKNESVHIYGDGLTSRDFCHIADIVKANILAALTDRKTAINTIYNIASGTEITLNQLYQILSKIFSHHNIKIKYDEFRPGDIRRSFGSIKKAGKLLGFVPYYKIDKSLLEIISHYDKTK